MLKINSKKLAEILSSDLNIADCEITSISTDSRAINNGDLFIAIRGEKFDGHNFIEDVFNQGAALAIVDTYCQTVPLEKQILVKDTAIAYGLIGRYVREGYNNPVIGLTGSAGKTTTKEQIRFILQKFGSVYATEKNLNNHIGVPKNLISMDMNSDYAVFEMGMSSLGEISNLTSFVKPDIAIVTNVFPMHIEFFNEYKEIAQAKSEIFEGVSEDSKVSTAVINKDTDFADVLIEKAKTEGVKNIITYGKDDAVVKLVSTEEILEGLSVVAKIADDEFTYTLSERGEHKIYNSLCVLSVIYALGLDYKKAALYMKEFSALEGRGKHHCLSLENGDKYTLIDDSYSGQPAAMEYALKQLSKMSSSGRKIAVLGKMAELGDFSKQEHAKIGEVANACDVDVVIAVCEEAKEILNHISDDKEKHYFESKDGVAEFLFNDMLKKDDILLIKGARYSSRVFEVAEYLIGRGKK